MKLKYNIRLDLMAMIWVGREDPRPGVLVCWFCSSVSLAAFMSDSKDCFVTPLITVLSLDNELIEVVYWVCFDLLEINYWCVIELGAPPPPKSRQYPTIPHAYVGLEGNIY